MHDYGEHIRQYAHEVVSTRQWKGTVVCTSYDPKKRAIKGMLVPQMIETGWIPVPSLDAGKGFGIGVGPRPGSAEQLDGDVFDVEFEGGDPNTPIAKMKHHSEQDTPPEIQPGEILVNHQSGMKDKYSADGSRTQSHPNGATDTWDKTGNMVRNLLGNAETVVANLVKNEVAKKVVTGVVHLATG